MKNVPRHHCLIYEGAPSDLLPVIAATVEQRLKEGYRCLYLNSAAMVSGLRSCLSAIGIDVAREVDKTSIELSSESVVTSSGEFDINLMIQKLENSLDQALKDGYIGLWVSGDITWEFGSEKNLVKLMEYESKLESLFWKRKELCGICQYHKDTLPTDSPRIAFQLRSGPQLQSWMRWSLPFAI